MKLRTKIFAVFAALTLLSTGFITVYSTLAQRRNSIDSELAKQQQVVGLLRNAVSGQYYSYLNQQIFTVFSTRSDLAVKAKILSSFARQLNFNEEELTSFLMRQQRSFNQVGLDLAAMHENTMVLTPQHVDILLDRSIGDSDLYSAMLAAWKNQREGYYLTLYHPDGRAGNYLSYTFVLSGYEGWTVSIIQNIDELMERYAVNDNLIIEQLKGNFYELGQNLQGAVVIADAGSSQVLLSSSTQLPFLKLPDDVTQQLGHSVESKILRIDTEGGRYFISGTYYKPLNWYIIALRKAIEINTPALQQGLVMLIVGAAVLLLSLLCSILLARTLTQRLSGIARQAELISNTDLQSEEGSGLKAVQPLPGNDEVAALSRAIYSMEQSLNQNISRLMQTTRQKNRLQGELNAARQIQLGMLPTAEDLPGSSALAIAGFLTPAEEVGGDFYDAFALDEERVFFTVGDVSDKGVPAALFMSMTMSLIRAGAAAGLPPEQVVKTVNDELSLRNPNMMFVTLYVGILNLKDGSLLAVNAGHCPPVICRKDGSVEELTEISGPAVGPLPELSYSQYQSRLSQGECLLLYTDGVSEAQNERNEFYGAQTITEFCRRVQFAALQPQQCIDALLEDVLKFRGSQVQTDDITLLCLKRC